MASKEVRVGDFVYSCHFNKPFMTRKKLVGIVREINENRAYVYFPLHYKGYGIALEYLSVVPSDDLYKYGLGKPERKALRRARNQLTTGEVEAHSQAEQINPKKEEAKALEEQMLKMALHESVHVDQSTQSPCQPWVPFASDIYGPIRNTNNLLEETDQPATSQKLHQSVSTTTTSTTTAHPITTSVPNQYANQAYTKTEIPWSKLNSTLVWKTFTDLVERGEVSIADCYGCYRSYQNLLLNLEEGRLPPQGTDDVDISDITEKLDFIASMGLMLDDNFLQKLEWI